MNITGMETECGNYIVDSIVDVGPTVLDADIKKELVESELYIPKNIYTEIETTNMEVNGTVNNSCGADEMMEEITNGSENETNTPVDDARAGSTKKKRRTKMKTKPNEMHMVTRRKTRSLLSTLESDKTDETSQPAKITTSEKDPGKDKEFEDSAERPYMCSACYKTYPSAKTLTSHKKRSCSGSRSGYTCHRCNRCFFSMLGLSIHSKIHWDPQTQFETVYANSSGSKGCSDNKPNKQFLNNKVNYVCDICGKLFSIRYALTLHKMIHVSQSSERKVKKTSDTENIKASDTQNIKTSDTEDIKTSDTEDIKTSDTQNIKASDTQDIKTYDTQNIKIEPTDDGIVQESNSFVDINIKQENQNSFLCNKFEDTNLEIDEGSERLITNRLDEKSPLINSPEAKPLENDIKFDPAEKQMAESSVTATADVNNKTSASFFCPICDLTFVSKIAYDNHHVTHKNSTIKQLLQGPPASVLRDSKGTFYYKILDSETKLTKMYTSVNDIQAVIDATVNGDRFDDKCVYICQMCKMGYHVYAAYVKHMQGHSDEKLFLCGICNKSFRKVGTLSIHMKSHVDSRQNFKCSICGMELSSHSKLTHHKATAHMHRVFECDICGKGFFRSWHLKEHRANHTEDEARECDVCGTSFTEIGSLRKHMWSHLKEAKRGITGPVSASKGVRNLQERAGEQSFSCDLCPKVYHSRNRLALHKRTHSREKLSKCNLCGKEFFSPSELNRHHRTHTGEKPFQCGECGKAFALATTLKDHIRSHTGEKPFKCFMCNKCYSSSSILGRHKLTHIGKRKFQCNQCDKSFLYNTSLQVHLRTHTGERPYTCEVCSKTFTVLCHYRVHMRIHTGERPYQCLYCDKDFNNYGSHYKHIRKHPEFRENLAVDNIDALSNVISMMETDQVVTEQIEEIA